MKTVEIRPSETKTAKQKQITNETNEIRNVEHRAHAPEFLDGSGTREKLQEPIAAPSNTHGQRYGGYSTRADADRPQLMSKAGGKLSLSLSRQRSR